MADEYKVDTEVGKVRLLISDVGGETGSDFIFHNEEIQAFLDMKGTVELAAAQALRTLAANTALVLKVIKFMELTTNGAETAKALRETAADLEKAYENEEGGAEEAIEIIEMNLGDISERELSLNRIRRGFA